MALAYGEFQAYTATYKDTNGTSRSKTCYLAPYISYTKSDGAGSASYTITGAGIALRANRAGSLTLKNYFTRAGSNSVISTTSQGGLVTSTSGHISFGADVSINLSTVNGYSAGEYCYSIRNGGPYTVTKTHSAQTFTVHTRNSTYGVKFFGLTWGANVLILSDTVSAKSSYTITLNGNGGTSTSATQWYGENLSLSGYSSSRTGYTFAGWYTAASGGSQVVTVQPNAATTYYAHWTENTATLTYSANGHGTAPQPVTMKYSTATTAAALPIEQYWACKGWNTASDGSGTMYQPDDVIKAANVVPSAKTLYAIWEKTAPDIFTKIDGIWCRGPLRVKANDQWFECTEGFIKIGGEWKPLG